MLSKTCQHYRYRVGCGGWFVALAVTLIVLKLLGFIGASWLWVLLPVWIIPALFVALAGCVMLFLLVVFCLVVTAALLD